MKVVLVAVIFIMAFSPTHGVAEEFSVNMSLEQADSLTGKLRAHDLAVHDLAYFHPSQLCRKNNGLFLPSIEEPRSLPNEYSFIMKVEILPGKRIKAELLPPSKPSEFKENDLDNLIYDLIEPDSLFYGGSIYCDDISSLLRRELFLMPLVSIDSHNNITELIEDLQGRNYQFAD